MPKKLPVYCYPARNSLGSGVYFRSPEDLGLPQLLQKLDTEGVTMEMMYWNGELHALPTDRKVLVRWSTMFDHNIEGYYARREVNLMAACGKDVVAFCALAGHVLVYNDHPILAGEDPCGLGKATDVDTSELWAAINRAKCIIQT